MDPASIAGLATAGIQVIDILASRIQQASQFWKNVKNAPKRISDIFVDIDHLGTLLQACKLELDQQPINSVPAQNCLKHCRIVANELLLELITLDSRRFDLTATAKAGRKVKAAWKKEDIDEIVGKLDRAKHRLILAITICHQIGIRQAPAAIEEMMKSKVVPDILSELRANLASEIDRAISQTSSNVLDGITNQTVPIILTAVSEKVRLEMDEVTKSLEQSFAASSSHIVADINNNAVPSIVTGVGQTLMSGMNEARTDFEKCVAALSSPIVTTTQVTKEEVNQIHLLAQQLKHGQGQILESIASKSEMQQMREEFSGRFSQLSAMMGTFAERGGAEQEQSTSMRARPTDSTNISLTYPRGRPSLVTATASKLRKSNTSSFWKIRLPGMGPVCIVQKTARRRDLIQVRSADNSSEVEELVEDSEETYTISLAPARWKFFRGFHLKSTRTKYTNWQRSLRPVYLVEWEHEIWLYVRGGNLNDIRSIMERDSLNINIVDDNGFSMLHEAVGTGRLDVCSWLIQKGIDTTIGDYYGRNALWRISNIGEDTLVKFLIESVGMDPTEEDSKGTCLLNENYFMRTSMDFREAKVSRIQAADLFAYLLKQSLECVSESKVDFVERQLKEGRYLNRTLPFPDWKFVFLLEEYASALEEVGEFETQKRLRFNPWVAGVVMDYIRYTTLPPVIPVAILELLRKAVKYSANLHVLDYGHFGFSMAVTVLDFAVFSSNHIRHPRRTTFNWLMCLHRGTQSLARYFEDEQGYHRSANGIDRKDYFVNTHYKPYLLEYLVYSVTYDPEDDSNITFTLKVAIAPPVEFPEALDCPGTWVEDPVDQLLKDFEVRDRYDIEFVDDLGRALVEEYDSDDGDWHYKLVEESHNPTATEAEQGFQDRQLTEYDDQDFHFDDGRIGRMYSLWAISTAKFKDGDLDFKSAVVYNRDFDKNPIIVDYGFKPMNRWGEIWPSSRFRLKRCAIWAK